MRRPALLLLAALCAAATAAGAATQAAGPRAAAPGPAAAPAAPPPAALPGATPAPPPATGAAVPPPPAASTFGVAPAEPPVRLSLRDAEAAALTNHPLVLGAQAAAAEARQLVIEARAAYYPQVGGDVTGSLGNRDARVGAGTLFASRLFNREGQGLTLAQLITDSGRTPSLVASSRSHAGAADQTVQASRADILLAIDRAYFDVLRAQALVRVARQTVTARQTVSDQVTELARNKLKSDLDVSFANVNLGDARLLLLRAQAQELGAMDQLTREMGSTVSHVYALAEQPLPPVLAGDPEQLVRQALTDRPDLRSLRLEREAAGHFEQAERDLSWPVISLGGVAGSLPLIGPDAATVPDHYEGVTLDVHVPLFTGHLFSARRAAAHYRTVETDQQVRDLEESIARDVRGAWAGAKTAYESIAVSAEYLRQATQAMDLAQGRYNLGLSSIVELTQAQLNLTQAEIENLTAQYDYQTGYAVLQYTTGALR
jgi:outer membrane protein